MAASGLRRRGTLAPPSIANRRREGVGSETDHGQGLGGRRPLSPSMDLSAWLNHVVRFACLLVFAPGMIPWIRRPLRGLKSLVTAKLLSGVQN